MKPKPRFDVNASFCFNFAGLQPGFLPNGPGVFA
jgi:hypothetical protein